MSRSKVPDKPEPPTPEALQGAAQTFATNTKYDFTYWQAAALLLNHRPDPVLRWLHDWKPAADAEPPNRIDDYVLGTWAAFHCGGDRTRNLTSLLDANDPLVRVAAAVYLTHEDETAGLAALREMAELPGDAGSWAALNLARRGNRKALERAIEGLGRRTEIEHCHSPIREMLAARLLELLSNSAAAANLAPPILKPYEYRFEDAREFLDQHPDLAPVDPWLPINRDLRTD